jgi:hypothetical protein
LILVVWVLALGVFIVRGLLSYLGREQMTLDEATMILQDVWWKESRGEQRRMGRWLGWARLRYQRRVDSEADAPRST